MVVDHSYLILSAEIQGTRCMGPACNDSSGIPAWKISRAYTHNFGSKCRCGFMMQTSSFFVVVDELKKNWIEMLAREC